MLGPGHMAIMAPGDCGRRKGHPTGRLDAALPAHLRFAFFFIDLLALVILLIDI